MSDGPANGIKIPRPLSREFSLPNRNHLTPQIAVAPASTANRYRSSNASPDQFDTMRSVYGRAQGDGADPVYRRAKPDPTTLPEKSHYR
jgi:hypothetical protein